MWSNVML